METEDVKHDELEIIDLGDAKVETKQPSPFHEIKDTAFTWTWW